MDRYLEKLFKEYKSAHGIMKEVKYKFYERDFMEWLSKKEKELRYYEGLLETMDLVPSRGVVELNKGKYDSILPYLGENGKGISISQYNSTLVDKSKKYLSLSGEIATIGDIPILLRKKEIIELNNYFNYYVTQIPEDKKTVEAIANLVFNCNKIVFVGITGNIRDFDYKDKIKDLYNLKQELQAFTGKNFEGEVAFTNDSYVGAITPKYKLLKFNKTKNSI